MGHGGSCRRWDCAVVVEDCAQNALRKRPYSFWYDCAGQQLGKATSSASRDRDWDPAELIASNELEVQLNCDRFAVRKSAASGGNSADWRRRYTLGRELGAGQTAIVFEAFAASGVEESMGSCPGLGSPRTSSQRKQGRRVALKRFYNPGTMMFQQELKALSAVGIHPHVLRLLESFEGGRNEDVLVLEHCDGGDVYELYAANNGCSMLEAFVLQLIRQLLLALDHLVERGVEHRDVKPENLLLYGSSVDSMAVPQLKLADFGWGVVVQPQSRLPPVPPEGVGSLWYAPPELNPPLEGMDPLPAETPPGRSDMWSVGIIAYLLLIGHSPFNPALRIQDLTARENEVIRLAALGQINQSTRPWACLSDEARSFVAALIRPDARQRLSTQEAWKHPFIARHKDGVVDGYGSIPGPFPIQADRSEKWRCLDGFQRLSWLAFSRAITEPEMVEVPVLQTFISHQTIGTTMYWEHLAVELAEASVPAWFATQAAFTDVLVLAFNYLDSDGDGFLSISDLTQHVVGEDARESADCWVRKWRQGHESISNPAASGLSFSDFRGSLAATQSAHIPLRLEGMPREAIVNGSKPSGPIAALEADTRTKNDAVLEKRMQAIDEVCQRFLDEEFDDFGFGF